MHFVIAGKINCPQFSYAIMVAQRLKEHLPDFTYLKITKKPDEYDKWLFNICKENQWNHNKSPLIWREIGLKQGKKDFIGDMNKFLDLCYDYYGIPQDVLSAEHFNRGEMNWFTHRTESEYFENIKLEAKKRKEYRSRQVCITGATSFITQTIILELLQCDLQRKEDGLEIRLFDDPRKKHKLTGIAADTKHCAGPSGLGNCRVVSTLKEAFTNIDLVIVLDCFSRKTKESLVKWLKRNRNAMCALGKALNEYAPKHCRVIIGSPSTQPICYNATVLASFATKLHVRNIVAVTQDLGREMLKKLSMKANVPLKELYCPPVWGFIGLNKFIDVQRTLQTHFYKVPGKRPNSTLPQGTEEYELRTSECMLSDEDTIELFKQVSRDKTQTFPQLGRWPCLAKATAIIDLLKVWSLKQEDGNGEILSLGVYSDGTFNIPRGIYWSQPVILKDGFWVPFANFPIPRPPNFDMYYFFMISVASVYQTKVKPRIYIPPKKIFIPKEKKENCFDKIAEEIGMPVIRTDAESVIYVKYLAKKEMGIDLDEVITTIKEEEDEKSEILPQEEPEKHIFCECWRQELKELQKTVFDRSSTTEVEVDLSENVSRSEWSVINTPEKISEFGIKTATVDAPGENLSDEKIFNAEILKKDSINASSSFSPVCSCGRFSTGSVCKCLEPAGSALSPHDLPPVIEEDKVSTEHFYKEQNAQVFNEDSKDIIYEDTYLGEKQVSFDSNAKQDETGFRLKLYGKKDAVHDTKAELKMKKRILKYERDGEESAEEEKEEREEKEEKEEKGSMTSTKTEDSATTLPDKFQISVEGTFYDIIGDQNGLERLEILQKNATSKESSKTFKEMYVDEMTKSLQVLSLDMDKSAESLSLSYHGEDDYTFPCRLKNLPDLLGEQCSTISLEEDLDAIWGEGLHSEGGKEKDEEKSIKEKRKKRKREGIPLCCLCRCLVPEGLPCCPCGSTTVVEVFKKESVEVFIQSEDDINYTIEFFETKLPSNYQPLKSPSEISTVDEVSQFKEQKLLPPESFLPFFPKPENEFKEPDRPLKLRKEYMASFKETKREIPPKCEEFMNEAQEQLERMQVEAEGKLVDEEEEEEEDNVPQVICEEMEYIKTDFSDLKLFIPCGLEDWRLTVQKKYREWFFQGHKIKDETYYNIAVEEVSEDEFELDQDIEQYFEK